MRLTKRERSFLRDTGNRLIFGFGWENVSIGCKDGMLSVHGEYKGKHVEWLYPRIDFHYPVSPKTGGRLLANELAFLHGGTPA